MGLVQPESSTFNAESDYDLLVTAVAGNKEDRRVATNAFVGRHISTIYAFCKQFQNSLGGKDGVSDLTMATLQRAIENADTFDNTGITNEAHGRARTTRWLLRIAKNILYDWLSSTRESKPVPLSMVGTMRDGQAVDGRFEPLSDEAADKCEDPAAQGAFEVDGIDTAHVPSPERVCLDKALEQLSERDREIILLSITYSLDGEQLDIPDHVRDGICRRWATTKENIRTIRKRAMASIRKYVLTHCPQRARS